MTGHHSEVMGYSERIPSPDNMQEFGIFGALD